MSESRRDFLDKLSKGISLGTALIIGGGAGYYKGLSDGTKSGKKQAYESWHEPDAQSPVSKSWQGEKNIPAGEMLTFVDDNDEMMIFAEVSIQSDQPFDFVVLTEGSLDRFEQGESTQVQKGTMFNTTHVDFQMAYANTFPMTFVVDNTRRGDVPPVPNLPVEIDITTRIEKPYSRQ